MDSIYKEIVKDALFPKKKGIISKRNKYLRINEIREYSPTEIKRIRSYLQLSVSLFAKLMGVSVKTVEAWERGDNAPNGTACRLLEMIRRNPDILLDSGVVDDLTGFN